MRPIAERAEKPIVHTFAESDSSEAAIDAQSRNYRYINFFYKFKGIITTQDIKSALF